MDAIGDEDSEWEYEYDENETEDFYVVLELPSASSSKPKSKADELFAAHDPTKPKKKAAPQTGAKRRRGASADGHTNENGSSVAPTTPAGENNKQASTQPQLLQELLDLNIAAASSKAALDASPKGLQIMDLESDEPMAMYQGQIYSCQWASSLGSDLLFMRRPEEPGPDYRPLHSFKDVDILGIGAAKLVASPATVERRQDFTRLSDLDAPLTNANPNIQNEDVIRQARFLGRIAEIKAKRGEQVGNLKSLAESVQRNPENFGPDGKRKRGGRARAATATPRRIPTVAENRPSPTVDTPTIASTRTRRASTPTPATWTELDQDEEMVDG